MILTDLLRRKNMQYPDDKKFRILIADDSEINRELLSDMLSDTYSIDEAADGREALSLLERHAYDYALVLLDIVMPEMSGFEILMYMNRCAWIEDLPVIMISSDAAPSSIKKTYELGASDFILRPFDQDIVRQRVANTIALYAKKRNMTKLIAQKVYENRKNSDLMISIMSHIVEFRNGESGPHVFRIMEYTNKLLRLLMKKTDKYPLTSKQISLIASASALHDIGKITVPEEILNKPDKLTAEEFEKIKAHPLKSAAMLESLPFPKDEPLIRTSYEICRWHHERWDGSGYPDGLKGDNIPISAQVVSIADSFDALSSPRCYKSAYSFETSAKMISDGECGVFNPLLVECLYEMLPSIGSEIVFPGQEKVSQSLSFREEIGEYDELASANALLRDFEIEQMKTRYLLGEMKDPAFAYRFEPSVLTLSPATAAWFDMPETVPNPTENELFKSRIDIHSLLRMIDLAKASTPEKPGIGFDDVISVNGKSWQCLFSAEALWAGDSASVYGVIGRIIRVREVDR